MKSLQPPVEKKDTYIIRLYCNFLQIPQQLYRDFKELKHLLSCSHGTYDDRRLVDQVKVIEVLGELDNKIVENVFGKNVTGKVIIIDHSTSMETISNEDRTKGMYRWGKESNIFPQLNNRYYKSINEDETHE